MEIIQVALGDRSYPIYIGTGISGCLGRLLREHPVGARLLLITNTAVRGLYGRAIEESLAEAGFSVTVGEIGDGEEHKTLNTAERLYDLAFTAGLDRTSPVVALGGGVIGDVAGFVAATYMRGVPFVQVPTTLLAQVDSSVGGKVAVNHPRGKNIIGAFYQPRLVLADTVALKTLPPREIRSGLAEVIKYGVIWDASFFSWLEENMDRLLAGCQDALSTAVRESCRIKAEVVGEDETEAGLRAVLNYGHTAGHAVEALTGYRCYTHGEAVGIGMAVAARLAETLGIMPRGDRKRVEALIRRAGLPSDLPAGLKAKELLECFYHDKKVTGGRLTFVLPEQIGRVVIKKDLEEAACLRMLDPMF